MTSTTTTSTGGAGVSDLSFLKEGAQFETARTICKLVVEFLRSHEALSQHLAKTGRPSLLAEYRLPRKLFQILAGTLMDIDVVDYSQYQKADPNAQTAFDCSVAETIANLFADRIMKERNSTFEMGDALDGGAKLEINLDELEASDTSACVSKVSKDTSFEVVIPTFNETSFMW